MKKIKRIALILISSLLEVVAAAPKSQALTLFESGTLASIESGSGLAIGSDQNVSPPNDGQWIGAIFGLISSASITGISAHIGVGNSDGFFSSIIPIDAATSPLPNFTPTEIELFSLAHTVFNVGTSPPDSIEIFLSMPVTLGAGEYAIVIGSGAFGTNGDGFMPRGQPLTNELRLIDKGGDGLDVWIAEADNLRARITLEGECTDSLGRFCVRGSIPEPSTLTIFALGLAGMGFVRRRRAV